MWTANESEDEKFKVYVRVRPILPWERQSGFSKKC